MALHGFLSERVRDAVSRWQKSTFNIRVNLAYQWQQSRVIVFLRHRNQFDETVVRTSIFRENYTLIDLIQSNG